MPHPALITLGAVKLLALGLWLLGLPAPWAALLFFIGDIWVLWNLFVPGASGLTPTSTRFDTDRAEIWLTVDDGPDEHDTPRLLDALERHGARATFFLVGEHAACHPGLVAEIARRGHEVAHHTHTHPDGTFWCASPARLRRELDDALRVFDSAGVRPRRFRAPVGIKNLFLARELSLRGLACVAWNRRSGDSFARDPARVAARVAKRARPGDIVLMHEGPRLHAGVRVAAVEHLLAALDARGFRCVIPSDAQLR